jgi:Domain of unknown function (DUF4386)
MSRTSAQSYARIAGILLLITILAAVFGELYVPSKLVVPDAAATLKNISTSNLLFRASFAMYLVEAICDVSLALVFYVLLKPVSTNIALLAAFFGLVSTATFAFAELFYFSPAVITLGAGSSAAWSTAQQAAFTQTALTIYNYGATAFSVFYGIESVLRGYLIFRSGYLPRLLGALLALGGLGFMAKNFVFVLAPAYDSPIYALPMFVAMVPLTGWLLLKGLDRERWEEQQSAVAAESI